MGLDGTRVRKLLQQFNLQKLFIEELGWDHLQANLPVTVDGQAYRLTAVAHKRGMIAFSCTPTTGSALPDYATRRKIERIVAKTHAEHLIVFLDPAKTTQLWQWIKREPGRPAASREHVWNKSQSGEALIQKLGNLVFTLDEEGNVTILDSTGRVRAGFDIERVTKRFYERFKAEHDGFTKFIKGIPDDEMHRWYVSVMLNRLMFIYFVQKKGFLNQDPAYLRTKLAQSKQAGKDRFYNDLLCPLFFDGFATRENERSDRTKKLLGTVPYLNGGIFLKHQIEELYGKTITVADTAFEKLFAFFDAYQWHLDERPLRKDDEINPDVLGYIFEKYINQKQMGAYYTKEDITEYISKKTIIPFLLNAAKKECPNEFKPDGNIWKLLRDDPERYIYPSVRHGVIGDDGHIVPLPEEVAAGISDTAKRDGWNKAVSQQYALPTESWREYAIRRERCIYLCDELRRGTVSSVNDLITLNLDIRQFAQDVIVNAAIPELICAIYQSIEGITVLDPTCGSGAFLFAALNILEPLYEACLDRMEAFTSDKVAIKNLRNTERLAEFKKTLARIALHPSHRYFILKSIIINNLYGVDIMEEAVEICKLRLFLKLVAQVDCVEQIEPLPDIDFNIRAGNTLVGFASFDQAKKAIAFGSLDFEGAADKIDQRASIVELNFDRFRQSQITSSKEPTADYSRLMKQAILTPLNGLRLELDKYLATNYGFVGEKKLGEFRKSHQPFHWFVEFYGIMKAGGFDVIIGNPPWAEYAKVKSTYQVRGYSTEKCGNLHGICTERSLQLRNQSGHLSFIVQLPLVSSSRMASVRDALRLKSSTLHIIPFDDRPGKLFDGLQHCRSVIFFAGPEEGCGQVSVFTTRYQRWPTETRQHLFNGITFTRIRPSSLFPSMFPKFDSSSFESLFSRINGLATTTVGTITTSRETEHFIFYQEATQYWVKATVGLPYYAKNGKVGPPAHGRYLYFPDATRAHAVCAILNSSLFYAYFIAYGDCFHLSDTLASAFPIVENLISHRHLADANRRLLKELDENSERKTIRTKDGNEIRYAEYFVSKSKPLLDEIDRIMAACFGLDEPETDAVINFDIKYRMGGEGEDADILQDGESEQTFPATAADRQLCAIALEIARVIPDLSPDVWIDGVVLAVKNDICETALLDAGKRKRFRQLVQKHPLDLFGITVLPLNDLRHTLVAANAVKIDQQAQTVSEGSGWQTFRDALGKLPAGFVTLIAEALKNITDNAADLTQAGVDAAAVKSTIRQGRTGATVA